MDADFQKAGSAAAFSVSVNPVTAAKSLGEQDRNDGRGVMREQEIFMIQSLMVPVTRISDKAA